MEKERYVLCWWDCKNRCSHCEKQNGVFPKKLKNEIAIQSSSSTYLSIYWRKQTLIQKDICTHTFIATLLTVVKVWNQPECPSIDEWKRRHTHTLNYCSTIEKEWNSAIFDNMDGPREYYAKWSKSKKDKYHVISLICVIWKTNRDRLTDTESKQVVGVWGRQTRWRRWRDTDFQV